MYDQGARRHRVQLALKSPLIFLSHLPISCSIPFWLIRDKDSNINENQTVLDLVHLSIVRVNCLLEPVLLSAHGHWLLDRSERQVVGLLRLVESQRLRSQDPPVDSIKTLKMKWWEWFIYYRSWVSICLSSHGGRWPPKFTHPKAVLGQVIIMRMKTCRIQETVWDPCRPMRQCKVAVLPAAVWVVEI